MKKSFFLLFTILQELKIQTIMNYIYKMHKGISMTKSEKRAKNYIKTCNILILHKNSSNRKHITIRITTAKLSYI